MRYGHPHGTLFNVCDFVSKAIEPSSDDMNSTPLRFNVRQALNVLASTYLTMGEYLRSEQEMLYVYVVDFRTHARTLLQTGTSARKSLWHCVHGRRRVARGRMATATTGRQVARNMRYLSHDHL